MKGEFEREPGTTRTDIRLVDEDESKDFWIHFKRRKRLILGVFVVLAISIIILVVAFSEKKGVRNNQPSFEILQKVVNLPKTSFQKTQTLILSNGMEILLVSDPEASASGAGLVVNVGSKHEPREYPGLAHFLEHLLFMGSEKYPEESSLFKAVSMSNGYTNAYTGNEVTGYYFTSTHSGYEGLLDIWSQFFVGPLFKKDSVNREAEAVNSEYVNALSNENYRSDFILKLMMNPEHPSSWFSIGNLDSLRDGPRRSGKDIVQDVRKFYDNYYHGGNMKGILTSNLEFDALQKLAENYFGKIKPRKTDDKPNFNSFPKIDAPGYFKGRVVRYDRMSDDVLRIIFKLDEVITKFNERPLHYICHLVNSLHKGGLSERLSTQFLADDVNCLVYNWGEDTDYSILEIAIDITDKGEDNIPELLTIIFSYLQFLDKNGVSENIYNELIKSSRLEFTYKEGKKDLHDDIYEILSNLRYLGVTEAFSGGEIYNKFDEGMIKGFLKELRIENALILYGDEDITPSPKAAAEKPPSSASILKNSDDLKNFLNPIDDAPIYDKLYYISYDWAYMGESLMNAIMGSTLPLMSSFSLPIENSYIPTNLKLLGVDCNVTLLDCRDNLTKLENDSAPLKIVSNDKAEVYHLKSVSDLQPKFLFQMKFLSPYNSKTEEDFVNFMIFKNFIRRRAKEIIFNANVASIKTEIENNEISVYGFSERLSLYIKDLIRIIRNIDVSDEEFKALRNSTSDDILDLMQSPGYKQVIQHLKNTVAPYPIDYARAYSLCLGITKSDYFKKLLSKLRLKVFIGGNIEKEDALYLWKDIDSILNYQPMNESEIYRPSILKLNQTQSYVYRFDNGNEDDNNEATGNYYQIGVNSIRDSEKAILLSNLIDPSAFAYLRSNLQLGYVAFSYYGNLYGIDHIMILVQGTKARPEKINEKIEEFLFVFEEQLKNLTEQGMASYVASRIQKISSRKRSLQEHMNYFWKIADCNSTQYDLWKKEILELKTITKEEMVKFFEEIFKFNRKISFQMYARSSHEAMGETTTPANLTFSRSEQVRISNETEFRTRPKYPYVDEKLYIS